MSDAASRMQTALDEYAENIQRFKRGEITPDQFRPLRLGMGVYAQLAHVKHMQRIKVPGGRMTAAQLEVVAEVTERWALGLAHVTTRQDIQLHHLEIEETVELQRVLAKADVTTVGACADTVRNVTASHLAGVAPDEVFDVTPHAHAITQYFLFHPHNRKLPRKFKIGLSGSVRDHAQIMINDLGLLARVTDAGRGFAVYVAGGLGSTPEIAHLWRDFVPERDVLAACDAVIRVFWRDGERKNRKKARIKFLLRKLGEAEFLKRLDDELAKIKAEEGAKIEADLDRYLGEYTNEEAPPPAPGGDAIGDAAFARWKRTNTLAQTQAGYRVVTIKLPLGDITAEQMRRLAALSREFGNGEVRTTNTQNFVMRFVPEGHLVGLHRALSQIGLAEPDAGHITDIVACPGADYCSLAITKSMGVGARVREHLSESGNRAEADDLVQKIGAFDIKISGCPNSCGQHHVADIGMTGLMVKGKDGVERPHYSLRVGGGCGPDAKIGDRLDGRVPEEETPKVIAAIARHYVTERAEGESFREFVARKGASEIGRIGFAAATDVI
ncbi:nitrite/sulfite reductase [Polyangium jinanense]|uniref:Nitrite/sulfite reductase n=1 Tax=Polyangium jinanense TaxID=2829994 RepID=A0A9X4APD8_9BACT|nr:nitrite/sulfite reductase [Polyangium jinanense]MDC3953688.1 nitrite/sulfite reductase [Polyangium jinanense]MDC3979191.1 nitrite/sulfite reductase [Polyangium jinanense]